MSEITQITNPFGDGGKAPVPVMARALSAREDTEVMALIAMAKRDPRDERAAAGKIIQAFQRTGLAEEAQYEFARGGSKISGPSIRAAEAMAQEWGNLATGWSELERTQGPDGVGVSVIEAFAVDYQRTRREAIKFVVRHWRDTRDGGYKLREERDIYELCANQAQRRKRACILALLPGDVVEMAMQQSEATLKAKADTSPEGIADLVEKFAKLGVTKPMLEKRLQRNLDAMSPAQMVGLKRIGLSLRDGMSDIAEWFEVPPAGAPAAAPGSAAAGAADAVAQATQQRRARPKEGAGAVAATAVKGADPAAPAAAAPAQTPAQPPAEPPAAAQGGQPAAGAQASMLDEAPVPPDAQAEEPLVLEYVRRINEPAVTAARALELVDQARTDLKTKQARDRVSAAYEARFPEAG
jgi:hypothetical protein